MTRTAGTTRGLLARLLLLGLLLIGLGVVHTLAHAAAHDGVAGHTTTRHLGPADAADLESVTGAGDIPHPTNAVAASDVDSLPEAGCWASVPTGPWQGLPARSEAGITTVTHATPPTDGRVGHHAPTAPHAPGVLRI
ncbi:hypothetical protein GCM10010145_17530 [Streptomyces ruber]|uniref:Uncharacterized protein n=2 Tax=Streptomyces TaxID=1883 RepID=A0A918B9G3_9ACTN|nr:hypothetical protein [Streptomyces ruber]GGQ49179.1 hypothetical protein GCM10010145_17530 [Streptomyces ruber]